MTGRDLITGALRLIGAIATGEAPSANEQNDALTALNDMLDSWSSEGLIVPNTSRDTILLVPGQAAYTMGPSGSPSLTSPRPLKVVEALIQVANTNPILEIPIEIINVEQYASISVKTVQSTIPTRIYVEGTYPNETMDLWPVPSAANTLVLYSVKPLAQIAAAALSTVLSLPEGYQRALRFNLALELAPEFGKQATVELLEIAANAKAIIKRKNIKPIYMELEPIGTERRRFNLYTGDI